jgi:hypothetical protein
MRFFRSLDELRSNGLRGDTMTKVAGIHGLRSSCATENSAAPTVIDPLDRLLCDDDRISLHCRQHSLPLQFDESRIAAIDRLIRNTKLQRSVSNLNEPIMKVAFMWGTGYAGRGHSNPGETDEPK